MHLNVCVCLGVSVCVLVCGYLESMLPKELQRVGKHLDSPHPPTAHCLQLRLHGEVLWENEQNRCKTSQSH